jgi:hypothetical protein
VPGASALAEARERLGPEPLRVLFAKAAQPLATKATRGAWYRHWRVMVVDGTCLDVPDSPANQALGRARSGRGEGVGAFPQVRVVGLVEAGTHAIVDAAQGPYATGEQTLAPASEPDTRSSLAPQPNTHRPRRSAGAAPC